MRNLWKRLVVLPVALLVVVGMLTAAQARDKKDVKKIASQMGKALQAGNVDVACEKARELGESGSSDAAKILLEMTFQDPFPQEPGKTNKFVEAVSEALAQLTDEKSTDFLVKFLKKKSRDNRLKMMIIQVLGQRTDAASEAALIEALEDRDPAVIGQAARALGARNAVGAVDGLIAALETLEKQKGTPWHDVRSALHAITGHDIEAAADWKNFWEPRKATFDPAKDRGDAEGVGGTVMRDAPKLFGSEIISKKVVIILDVSGSMHIKDPPTPGSEEATMPDGDGTTARPQPAPQPAPGAPDPNAKGQCPDCGKEHGGVGLPFERQRIERAKKELTKVVNALAGDVIFNLIVYSTDTKSWQDKKLVPANPGNKKSAIDFVKSLKADGITRTNDALDRGFDFADADTIYLLSDGAPTDKGGQPLPATATEPTKESLEKIYEQVEKLNRTRKVRLHTLAFKGAPASFMKRLADENGGKYADIP